MNPLVLLLTRRYLSHSIHEKSISTMVKICFLGIFLGSFSLALITAIMHGFEIEIHKKMLGIHAHASIKSPDELNVEAITTVLHNEFPQITGISPTSSGYALIPATTDGSMPNVIMLRAINPAAEATVSTLAQKISSPTPAGMCPLLHSLNNNQVLVGKKFAQEYHHDIGDEVQLLYPDRDATGPESHVSLLRTKATIGGTFQTGIDEFDTSVIFCSFNFFETLFPENTINQMNLKFKPGTAENSILSALRKRLNLEVYSWKELYPALVSALTLEKYVMFIIIMLITLVASMNILSLLFMEITNKRADIAILRVMGTPNKTISSIFIFMGLTISTIATTSGLLAAYGTSLLFHYYPFIKLPDVYYVSHLPVKMSWGIGLTVFVVVTILSLIASWLPTRKISSLNIARILRSEG